MKFECEKTLLASAIDGVSRAITNRAAIPVLEGIYMKAEGFNLTLTGYDMEMGITTTIECNVLVPGETVLDAKLLSAMVNRMPAGDVCIELNDEGQAKISGGVAEFEIPALNASDYPSLPVTGADNTMTVKCGMLREMIEKTIYAVSQDDKKPAHTGELFVIEPGSLTIVALDGYRLAIIQREVECTRDIRIIIPAKTLQELLKIMGGADDDVKIDANRRYVVFTSNGYTIMSRLIEGDFLNYESVIDRACVAHYYRSFEEPAAHLLCRGSRDGPLPDAAGQGRGRVRAGLDGGRRGRDRLQQPVSAGCTALLEV